MNTPSPAPIEHSDCQADLMLLYNKYWRIQTLKMKRDSVLGECDNQQQLGCVKHGSHFDAPSAAQRVF